jgi:hypothetical protein
MDRYLLKDHWARLVVDFKDDERELHGRDGYSTDQLVMDLMDHLRHTRFRQWTLMTQKRGEEYERMIAVLTRRGHDPEAITRVLDTEDLWTVTLELATQ